MNVSSFRHQHLLSISSTVSASHRKPFMEHCRKVARSVNDFLGKGRGVKAVTFLITAVAGGFSGAFIQSLWQISHLAVCLFWIPVLAVCLIYWKGNRSIEQEEEGEILLNNFDKEWKELLAERKEAATHLARHTGAQMMMSECGQSPVEMSPNDNVEKVIKFWVKLCKKEPAWGHAPEKFKELFFEAFIGYCYQLKYTISKRSLSEVKSVCNKYQAMWKAESEEFNFQSFISKERAGRL